MPNETQNLKVLQEQTIKLKEKIDNKRKELDELEKEWRLKIKEYYGN